MYFLHARDTDESAPGGCWTCTHWHGRTTGNGVHAVCDREPGRPFVTGQSIIGCVFWEREPGADDVVPPPCSGQP